MLLNFRMSGIRVMLLWLLGRNMWEGFQQRRRKPGESSDEYVHYLDHGDICTGVSTCQNLLNYMCKIICVSYNLNYKCKHTNFTYVQFIPCHFYLNKALLTFLKNVKKKNKPAFCLRFQLISFGKCGKFYLSPQAKFAWLIHHGINFQL